MRESILKLQKEFERVREKGYIKGIYNSLSSIGRTFEEELGLSLNKACIPDYDGIEIKTRRAYSKSYITLFNAVPDGTNSGEIERLKNTYGYPCKKDKNYKVLYAEVYGNKMVYAGVKYQYKLEVSKNDKRIYLCVYNRNGKLIDKNTFWSFDYLKNKITTKLNVMAVINAWPKEIDHWNYFKYYKIKFYIFKSFNKFLSLIENGKIKLTLKIGIYLSGDRYGETYDHGCGFCLSESDLPQLFYEYNIKNGKLT